jgi:Flp pilus assembly protein TadG
VARRTDASTMFGRRRSVRTAGRRTARERGAALVEAALVMPVLLMIVFGIIEFGTTYSNYIGLRDGVRQAARLGSVGNVGSSTSCNLTGASEASTAIKQLMCLTKAQTGLDTTQVRVKIMAANPDFSGAGTFAKNDALVVCAQIPTNAVTGFLGTAIAGKTLRTKVAMRIEDSDMDLVATAGDEDAPTGENWSWCTYEALAL